MLNLTNLEENQNVLVKYLQESDYKYSYSYIKCIKNELKLILTNGSDFESYEDYYLFRLENKQADCKYPFKSHITTIMNFDLYNLLPNGHRNKHQLFEKEDALCNEFLNIIIVYERLVDKNSKNERTRYDEIHEAKTFFNKMQSFDLFTLSDIREAHILSYFINQDNEFIRGYSSKWRLHIFFKTVGIEISECNRLAFLLPLLKYHRKNIKYLTDDEVSKIKTALKNNDDLSYMAIAIGTLLLYTGIRAVDIANLKLNDINWDNEIISITQSKTSQPLELP